MSPQHVTPPIFVSMICGAIATVIIIRLFVYQGESTWPAWAGVGIAAVIMGYLLYGHA